MNGRLEGCVALVTGAAHGIGRAVVRRYLEEGASGVVAVDRDADALEVLRDEAPDRIRTVAGDVRDFDTHRRATDRALDAHGRLDVLVGNAGVFDFWRPLRGYTDALLASSMDELFAINVRGYLYSALAAREALVASRGCMVFTASVAGFHAGGGGVLYTMAKHAVVGMIRQLALEMAPDVRVNGVGPGGTVTGLAGTEALGHADRRAAADAQSFRSRMANAVPLRAAQEPEDHAGLYVLLASRRDGRAITGEVMMSDGGVGIRSV